MNAILAATVSSDVLAVDITHVNDHFADGGRVLVFSGTTADLGYLEHLSRQAGFASEVVSRRGIVKDSWDVEYRTYRLTPESSREDR